MALTLMRPAGEDHRREEIYLRARSYNREAYNREDAGGVAKTDELDPVWISDPILTAWVPLAGPAQSSLNLRVFIF